MNNTTRCALVVLAASAAGLSSAQPYPAKTIRIVTSEPGSGNDLTARVIAQGLSATIGQNVVVDNRGFAAGETAARAAPDGYTLICYGSPLWLAPFIRARVPYDPVKDFTPVTLATTSPNILVVHPSVPVNNVKELIALAKSKPAQLNFATGTAGSSAHLATELFKSMAAVDMVRVPFRGTGPAMTALVGGHVHLMFSIGSAAVPHVRSGKLKALGVTSLKPSALVPGMPTVASAGLPGYEAVSIQGIFATAGTPPAVVTYLSDEIRKVLTRPDIREKLFNSGTETVGSSPEEFGAVVRNEMTRLGKLIRDTGIRDE